SYGADAHFEYAQNMLRITVRNATQHRQLSHADGPLEFGRIEHGITKRVVIDDPFVSRDQLRITPSNGRLRVENLSRHTPIDVVGCDEALSTGESGEFDMPCELAVGRTRITIELAPVERAVGASWQTVLRPAGPVAVAAALNLAETHEALTP